MSTTADHPHDRSDLNARSPRTAASGFEVLIAYGAIAIGILARFVPRSAMWLDEALSVNIANGPIGEIPARLKVDGHPPLYYTLLHLWMKIGGTGDEWVRAFSGVVSVLGIPVAWALGSRLLAEREPGSDRRVLHHRAGMYCAAVFALLPFGVRYGAEARMYSMVMTLVLLFSWALIELWRQPRPPVAAALAATTSLLLWTHYWTMWIVGAAGIIAVFTWGRLEWLDRRNDSRGDDGGGDRPDATIRRSATETRRAAITALTALAIGGLTFLPWLPTLAYQSAHTGTPWGSAFRPAAVAVVTMIDFAGGAMAESQVLSYVLVFLVVVALLAKSAPNRSGLLLSTPLNPPSWPPALLAALTLGLGWAVAFASGSTYASRYASVIFPLFAILVAFGLLLLTGAVRIAFATLVIFGSLLGIGREVTTSRSQSEVAAAAISRTVDPESNPLVVSCPDQLAVSLERATGGAYETVVFPDLGRDPRFVDWVDYAERNADADAAEFVTALNKRAEGRPIVLAVNLTYKTLETKCAQVAALLQSSRPTKTLIEGDGESYYESMSILYFPQP